MSHSIECSERIREMFTILARPDDSRILEIIQRFETDDRHQLSILKAYKSIISVVPPWLDTPINPVSRIGIVGASSVTTAYWPYLIMANIFDIPIKIKMRASDVHHIQMLSSIIVFALNDYGESGFVHYSDKWQISVQSGDALLKDGYWNDCDRLLVFGTDLSVERYRQVFPEPGRVFSFGHLESVMLVSLESLQSDCRWIDDVLAFGHVGCLAPRVVVPVDDIALELLASVLIENLQGLVTPDIGRAITLRNEFHGLRVAGIDVWMSPDGMWLISANRTLPMSSIPGHLNILSWDTLIKSDCRIGTLTRPLGGGNISFDLLAAQSDTAWKCPWGTAQFPSILWANGGIPVLSTLSH